MRYILKKLHGGNKPYMISLYNNNVYINSVFFDSESEAMKELQKWQSEANIMRKYVLNSITDKKPILYYNRIKSLSKYLNLSLFNSLLYLAKLEY